MNELNQILERHGLERNAVYLLELIPLIDMIWADGRNQPEEVAILQHFTTRHLANLSRYGEGLEVVTVEQANAFIEHFMAARPCPELLRDLRAFAAERLVQSGDRQTIDSIIHHCMDIASACVQSYPYQRGERVLTEEKQLLRELMAELSLPSESEV